MNRDWLEKDFYLLLGVAQDADQPAIKKAFRRMARELHPDANPDNPNATERFQEVSEAYEVLSDPERRAAYDQVRSLGAPSGGGFGSGAGGGFGGGSVRFEDLLGGAGGGIRDFINFGRGGGGAQRGANQFTTLDLTFEQAIKGTTQTVTVSGAGRCEKCSGSGAEPGTRVDVCASCGGTGTVAANQGVFSFTNPCGVCGGSGRNIETPCSRCQGSGQKNRTRTIKARIPPGVRDGNIVRLRGRGSPGRGGGAPGDLLVKVRVGFHPVFSRKDDNLTMQLPISFTEAALGARVNVPTLNGTVTLKIPAGTSSGRTFRIRKEGVQRGAGRQGDLLVTVNVAVPERLSRQAKKLLEEYRQKYEKTDLRAHL
ncbi:MAG: molecular chaperone DnaJ [bacterium]|nr:molecular chaperone DnaJ [bacterium]